MPTPTTSPQRPIATAHQASATAGDIHDQLRKLNFQVDALTARLHACSLIKRPVRTIASGVALAMLVWAGLGLILGFLLGAFMI